MSSSSRAFGRHRRRHEFLGDECKTPLPYRKLISVNLLHSKTYQMIKEVYRTDRATTTVKIKPGTKPNTEYEYGNDRISKQMYSLKSKAAV